VVTDKANHPVRGLSAKDPDHLREERFRVPGGGVAPEADLRRSAR